jgi:hypothetical protein
MTRKRFFLILSDPPTDDEASSDLPDLANTYRQAIIDAAQNPSSEEPALPRPRPAAMTDKPLPTPTDLPTEPAPPPAPPSPLPAEPTGVERPTAKTTKRSRAISKKSSTSPSVAEKDLSSEDSIATRSGLPKKAGNPSERVRVRRKRLWSDQDDSDSKAS